MTNTYRDRLLEVTGLLRAAESRVRILRTVAWPPEVRARFLANEAQELPQVELPRFDPAPVHEQLAEARRRIDFEPLVDEWLTRSADAIAASADLLASIGTPDFLRHGERLYGLPTTTQDGASPLELARLFDRVLGSSSAADLGAPPAACHLAQGVAQRLTEACRAHFGEDAPQVLVVDRLSSNALAGARRIQVRRDACFTDLDVEQLVQHEALVHVCTSLNGKYQDALPLLASSHAGTTRTQEGLAVFAEFVTGSLDPDRARRLADRVIAIQMAIDGADFIEVFRYFLERGSERTQAFENARRVFRGGVLTGGAPFTKDVVYLHGFLHVSGFLETAVAAGRVECVALLFCGKLDLADVPALARLAELGLCRPPKYLPDWARDRRFLATFLAYTSFLRALAPGSAEQEALEAIVGMPALTGFGSPRP